MVDEVEDLNLEISRAVNPLVFISHDTRDGELAEAFSNLLKSVSAGVLKSFRTSDRRGNQGIEFGIEWYPEIIKSIQAASDVVCLLTERSVDRPWILFEAGMAKGKLDTPILGVALGIELSKASTGPFAQFQNCADDEESLTKLVFQLVNRIPGSEPDRDTIRFQVGKFKLAVDGILKGFAEASPHVASSKKQKAEAVDNSSAKLFEEIKVMFQDLPSRIERAGVNRGGRRKRRFSPNMLEEMIFNSPNPYVGIRIGLSIMRDLCPWVYDEGSAHVSVLQSSKSPTTRKRAYRDLHELLRTTHQGRFLEKYLVEHEDDYVILNEVPRMLSHALDRVMG